VLLYLDRLRHRAECGHYRAREALVPPDRRVVAKQDPLGRERRADARDHVVLHLLDAR
jgi:hypothetical protein